MSAREPLDLATLTLHIGNHEPDHTFCVMEAVAYVAGEPWSDHPKCADQSLTSFAIYLNDNGTDEVRKKLATLVPKLVGTRVSGSTKRLRYYWANQAIHTFAPMALDAAGLRVEADKLRAIPEIASQSAAWSARSAALSAAESAAWSARSAESAAWSARSAALSAAESAAWSAAESAALSAAESAESAAWSARSAALSAAESAESAESAAWSARSAALSAAESAESAAWSARSAALSAAESAAESAESAAWSVAVAALELGCAIAKQIE